MSKSLPCRLDENSCGFPIFRHAGWYVMPPPCEQKKKRSHTRDRRRGFHRHNIQRTAHRCRSSFKNRDGDAMAMPMDSGLDPGNGAPPREGESHARMRCVALVVRFVLSSAVAEYVNRETASFFLCDFATDLRHFESTCARQRRTCRRVRSWAQAMRLHHYKGGCTRCVRRCPLVSLFAPSPGLSPAAGSLLISRLVSFRENARQSEWKGPFAYAPTCAVGGMPPFLADLHRVYYSALSFAAHAYSRRHALSTSLVLARTNATALTRLVV